MKEEAIELVYPFLQFGMTFYEAQNEAIRLVKDRIEQKEFQGQDFKHELKLLDEICNL